MGKVIRLVAGIGAIVVVVLATLGMMPSSNPSPTTPTHPSTGGAAATAVTSPSAGWVLDSMAADATWALIWALIVIIGLTVWWNNKGWAMLCSLAAMAFFTFVVYQHAPHAILFTTTEGRLHLATYVMGILILAIIADNVVGWTKAVPVALMIVGFAMLGSTTLKYLPPDIWAGLHIPSFGGGGLSTASQCTGVVERLPLTTTPRPIPDCNVGYGVLTGEVVFNSLTEPPLVVAAKQVVGYNYDKHYVSMAASYNAGSAIMDVVFCRRGTYWDGKQCAPPT